MKAKRVVGVNLDSLLILNIDTWQAWHPGRFTQPKRQTLPIKEDRWTPTLVWKG